MPSRKASHDRFARGGRNGSGYVSSLPSWKKSLLRSNIFSDRDREKEKKGKRREPISFHLHDSSKETFFQHFSALYRRGGEKEEKKNPFDWSYLL